MSNLIKSENLLKLITENLPDLLWIKDLNRNYIYANDATCKMFLNALPEDAIGKNDLYFVQKERDRFSNSPNWHTFGENCQESDLEVLEKLEAITVKECGTIRGVLRHFEINKAPFYNEEGKVIGIIGIARDITSQAILEEENYKLTYYDLLTKLPNRQKILLDILKTNPKACMIFNIDGFREVNDFFGIYNADKILQEVANRFFSNRLKAYRVGGDEFAITYYDNFSYDELKEKAFQILSILENEEYLIEDKTISLGFSVGIAKASNRLLSKADIAVSMAKNSHETVFIYNEDEKIEEKYKDNINMAYEIKKALAEDRIICFYQPIVNVNDSEILAYETLVRLKDSNGNIISPFKFLNFSKKIKLYHKISQRVILNACNTFKRKRDFFSINLSIDDIKNKETVDFIIKTLKKTRTASRVTFEILESEGIENYDEVLDFINKVKLIGAKIAIDDFGSGYSNFEHLLKLNVDYIKIDGSLIKNITSNEKQKIIIETISSFAKKIGIKTVAEFVETQEIFNHLKELEIDFAQGYYIGKPKQL
ncbi:PAS sensor-containing diguanylate cyclase/phosphodiesterase [Aliarcobacter faecis]|uniref:EAL domain-containing protein n=1 Tax=Aliarcobacter faecis TaxID=1564138 RepID=UPI00047DD73D|nr:EAL domain-containing protein [Aliarcobacter faecis]QKF74034.1 PAS sensor-containing diguanylate cyclase/phosphodiesterase [Aliarcobacter faecis]